jgi:HD-GYP domain-containing protein (c-di-GMP phosphodiesterase class II)
MSDEDIDRIRRLAKQQWQDADGRDRPLLTDDEVMNLSIKRGTLNDEEREVINNHIVATIKMLESLPFPKNLQNVPEYAGGHHEKMDGTGYPRGLKKEEMSVQARIMAVADIFEALTASDRPYKKGKKLSECLRIMGLMKKDNHIDPDIFEIFIRERVYLDYAEEFLDPEQIDEIDEASIPGYAG